MEYNFREVEKHWQEYWAKNKTFKAENDSAKTNIARYREQLDKIGFSFDWDREVRTSDPSYYKWTQWIFIQLFNSWYNPETNKAENISTLIEKFKNDSLSFGGNRTGAWENL